MPRRSGVSGTPRDHLVRQGEWPTGPFQSETPSSVLYSAEISRRLGAAIEAANVTKLEAAARIGIARSALYDLLDGNNFPDIHTITRAEKVFGPLWPCAHST